MAKGQNGSGIWVGFDSLFLHSPFSTSTSTLCFRTTASVSKLDREKVEPVYRERGPYHLLAMMLRMGREVREEETASECSSGCQSGWTLYLDQSYENLTPLTHQKGSGSVLQVEGQEEEEEDLSMVSDASSGPPHLHEEDYSYCCYSAAALANNGGKRRRVEAELQPQPREPSFLDDTASSPLFSFSKASHNGTTKIDPSEDHVLEFSSCFSATHFKRNPALERHLAYMQSSSPMKRSPTRRACREEEEKKMW